MPKPHAMPARPMPDPARVARDRLDDLMSPPPSDPPPDPQRIARAVVVVCRVCLVLAVCWLFAVVACRIGWAP